jgi:hypothetical protein
MKGFYRKLLPLMLLIPGIALTQQWGENARDKERWGRDNGNNPDGLAALVRAATAQYKDFNYAISMGYQPQACVSGRDGGAMGVHFANFGYVLDGLPPDVNAPDVLIYEPLPNGGYRLAGAEFITLIDGEPQGAPALEGHLLNYSGAPNRYGLPPHYELHVWAWKKNPDGTFADWNPDVSCDAYVAPL